MNKVLICLSPFSRFVKAKGASAPPHTYFFVSSYLLGIRLDGINVRIQGREYEWFQSHLHDCHNLLIISELFRWQIFILPPVKCIVDAKTVMYPKCIHSCQLFSKGTPWININLCATVQLVERCGRN